MKFYEELLDFDCFTFEMVAQLTGNTNTAEKTVQRLLKQGLIERVRRNLYVTINLVDYEPTASKYQIGSQVTQTAVISHHAALEYYGYANQVYHTITVSSKTRFQSFEFYGITYERNSYLSELGTVLTKDHVRIMDIERTIVDCLYTPNLAGGVEEIIRCFRMIPFVNEKKLLAYIKLFPNKAFCQRTGFILEMFQESLGLSTEIFTYLESQISRKNVSYLDSSNKTNCSFQKRWQLLVPEDVATTLTKGVEEHDL